MIIVRKLSPEDAEDYRTCRLDALRDTPSAFASSYEEEAPRTVEMIRELMASRMSARDNAMFGAYDGGRLIGLTGIFREERYRRRHKMIVVSVFVRPEYRGRKIGAALIDAAIAHARTIEGVERLELSVASDNEPAKALYASHGFTTWGREPAFAKHEGIEYDEDCMSLKL